MKFKKLFSVEFTHEYFSENGNTNSQKMKKYVELIPTVSCLSFMKKYRLQLRNKAGKLTCICPLDSATSKAFFPEEKLNFRFYLKIKDSSFLQFTDFGDLGYDVKEIFQNLTFPHYKLSKGNLKLEKLEYMAEDIFQVGKEPSTKESFFLKSLPIPNLKNSDFKITGLSSNPTGKIFDSVLKKYSFNAKPFAEQRFSLTYRAFPIWGSHAFGIVDVEVNGKNTSFDMEYKISFKARAEEWKYYVIGKTDSKVKIEQQNNGSAITFKNPVKPGQTDAVYLKMKNSFPQGDIGFFKISSNQKIKFSIQPQLKIQLKDDGKTIIPNLPNPKPKDNGIAIINIYS